MFFKGYKMVKTLGEKKGIIVRSFLQPILRDIYIYIYIYTLHYIKYITFTFTHYIYG